MCLKVCDARHTTLYIIRGGKGYCPSAGAAGNSYFRVGGKIFDVLFIMYLVIECSNFATVVE